MLPWCYGELALKPWDIERLCPVEIDYMLQGWQRRYDRLEDLFIVWDAYPQYQVASPKKHPPLERLFAHRKKRQSRKEKQNTLNEIMAEFGLQQEGG